ncbi:crosslink repair DNA glycosylase YcaQ family protein [soil metagenome]
MAAISADRARRIALGAQGFADPPASGRIDVRHFRRVLSRVALVQLDSVNVFARTHYMPFFSRLGPYDRAAVDRWLWQSRELFEYWGHEASVIPIEHYPLFRHRMDRGWHWKRIERMIVERPGFVESVLEEVRANGPLRTAQLSDPGVRDGEAMWGWSDGKVALEGLFLTGEVTTAARPNFVRHYDVTERVIPPEVLSEPGPDPDGARMELVTIAARSLGIGTAQDLADYHRIRMPVARPLIERLVQRGELEEVQVGEWGQPAYLHPEATTPRKVEGSALLSPFDSLVWFRPRIERIFDFHYRIEIYVPAAKRMYGYYVLPYLVDGRLVARVDLKTDRKAGRLRVQAAYSEEGVDRAGVARRLAVDLEVVAGWLGVDGVEVMAKGDLSDALGRRTG